MDDVLPQLVALKMMLQNNAEIQSLASSPLILSIMSLAYQGYSLDEFPKVGLTESWHQRLFDAYIERMFTRRGTTYQYPRTQTKHWLIWMAQRMTQASQTVFLIERLQLSCFQTRFQRIRYRLESALLSWLSFGLFYGLSRGILIGLSGELSIESNGGLSVDLSFGLLVGLISALLTGLFYGLLYGLIVGFLGNVRTVETLKWSWREAKSAFRAGLFVGLFVGLISWLGTGLIIGLSSGSSRGLSVGLNIGLISGLSVGLSIGLSGGFRGSEIQKKSEPNQGIWQSAHNALIAGLSVGLIFGLLGGLFGGGLLGGLNEGLIFGLLGGLSVGGTACLRHFALRFMLFRMGYIPWNYARFLDYATERLFLQKVGGGYIFIHRILLEHFAQMELEP